MARRPHRASSTRSIQDLEGGSLTTAGSGESLTVNGTAKIVCGGVQAANATVNSIDATVEPM
ncbi:hypothetical protein ACWGFX_21700 [Streptomyces xanthophaeus]